MSSGNSSFPQPIEYGLSLGSNMGDRLSHLANARRHVAALPNTVELSASPVYDTEPVDVEEKYADRSFLNAVLIVQSDLEPNRFNEAVHEIETVMGRVRGPNRNVPRPVDIDIIYADGIRIQSTALTIPHRRWSERRFVVQPLADVRPNLRLPGQTGTVCEILLSLPPTPTVVVYSQEWA